MMRWSVLAVIVGFGALGADGAAAQMLPFERTEGGRARAELTAAVFAEFQAVMADWVDAVNARDAERVAALYDEGAFLFIGEPITGRADIENRLEDWMSTLGSISFGLSQFDASTSLAYGSGRVVIMGTGSNDDAQGTMVLVLRRHGRDDWRIRSQTLLVDPPRGTAAGHQPGRTGQTPRSAENTPTGTIRS